MRIFIWRVILKPIVHTTTFIILVCMLIKWIQTIPVDESQVNKVITRNANHTRPTKDDDEMLDYMYYQWMPQTVTIILN